MSKRRGRPPADYSQAVRLIRIVEALQAGQAVTVADMTRDFNVSRRTVNRDLQVLASIFPIAEGATTAEGHKTWWMQGGARRETLQFTQLELVTLFMVRHLMRFLDGTDLQESLDSVLAKIRARIGPQAKRGRAGAAAGLRLDRKFHATAGAPKLYAGQADVLNDITTALLREHRLTLRHRKPAAARANTHTVLPLSLVAHQNGLYLVAYSETAEDVRTFAVERIEGATWLKGEAFSYPADFEPERYLAGAFGIVASRAPTEVRLRFSARARPYVEARRWHESQRFEPTADEGLDMVLRVDTTEELLQWILGWGPEAQVLAPRELRATVAERLRAATAAYPVDGGG